MPAIWTATVPSSGMDGENTVEQWRQMTSVTADRHEICLFNVVLILDVRQACLGVDEVGVVVVVVVLVVVVVVLQQTAHTVKIGHL